MPHRRKGTCCVSSHSCNLLHHRTLHPAAATDWKLAAVANFSNWAFCRSGTGENTQVTPRAVLRFSAGPRWNFAASCRYWIWDSFAGPAYDELPHIAM